MLNLGIIYDKDGKIIGHRTLPKIFFNPFLRYFGWQLASEYNLHTNTLEGIKLGRCPRKKNILENLKRSWCFKK